MWVNVEVWNPSEIAKTIPFPESKPFLGSGIRFQDKKHTGVSKMINTMDNTGDMPFHPRKPGAIFRCKA
jgi:hypothetical protein